MRGDEKANLALNANTGDAFQMNEYSTSCSCLYATEGSQKIRHLHPAVLTVLIKEVRCLA